MSWTGESANWINGVTVPFLGFMPLLRAVSSLSDSRVDSGNRAGFIFSSSVIQTFVD